MPLNITIDINGRVIEQYRIGRMELLRGNDEYHSYQIVEVPVGTPGDRAIDMTTWREGVVFSHKYSDSAARCVQIGLDAFLDKVGDDNGID